VLSTHAYPFLVHFRHWTPAGEHELLINLAPFISAELMQLPAFDRGVPDGSQAVGV
jgi:hypothetical protein